VPNHVAHRVERNVAGREDRADFLFTTRAAGEGPNAGKQFGEGERLGEIVVGAGVEAFYAVFDLVAGCQHDRWRADLRGPQPLYQLDAAQAWEHPVHDQEIVFVRQGAHERLPAVGLRLDGVALLDEDPRDQTRQPLFVLYY
jgi:hypothetical protein